MYVRLLPLLAVVLLASPAASFPPLPKAKERKLDAKEVAKAVEGTWEVTKMERGGGAAAKINYTITMKIEGKSLTQTLNLQGRELKAADSIITIDAAKTPPTFEVTSASVGGRPEYVRMKGILKVDGDTMTWAYVTAKGEAPKKIDGELQAGEMRYTFKRVKK